MHSCGRTRCAAGHPPTKDECVPSPNTHFPSQSFPLPQFPLQEPLGIGNKLSCMSLSHASLFSGLYLWKQKTRNTNFLFQASLLPSYPSIHTIFAVYGNLQIDVNTNQHPQLHFPLLYFLEFTNSREISHALYSWLCSCGPGHTGDIFQSIKQCQDLFSGPEANWHHLAMSRP